MISLDTNAWVRILTLDDPEQARAVTRRLAGERVFLPKTVLLELEWVLRYSYRLSRVSVAESFQKLLCLKGLEVEDRPSVLQACAWHAQGMDFADALHLASCPSPGTDCLLTFDRKFARLSAEAETRPKVELLELPPTE